MPEDNRRTEIKETSGLFNHTKKPTNITRYNLYNGITDFGNARQFDYYEGGYSGLIMLKAPKFMEDLKAYRTAEYGELIDNFHHLIQHEFKGLDGLENVSTDYLEVTDNIKTMQFISKVNQQGGTTITLNGYKERSGSLITKYTELYLYGIKDPGSQLKTYHGLIEEGLTEPIYANEVFTFLYVVTDNTGLNIEKAFILYNCQLTNAELNIYNTERGDIQNKELSLEMNCIPISGPKITKKAYELLHLLFQYKRTEDFDPTIVGFENGTKDGVGLLYPDIQSKKK